MWGNTPIVRAIAQNQAWSSSTSAKATSASCWRRARIRPSATSPDLKGKTVGALLGGDPYNVLSQMLRFELGNGDPKAHDINVVNTPTAGAGGDDSAPAWTRRSLIYPAFLKANAEIGTVGIMNSFGYTESHYKGPAGEGAGILLRVGQEVAVLSRRLLPAPLVLDRAARSLVKDNPDSSPRSSMAQQEAVGKLSAMDPGEVSELSRKYWELDPKLGALVVEGRRALPARLVLADRRRRRGAAGNIEVHGRGQA